MVVAVRLGPMLVIGFGVGYVGVADLCMVVLVLVLDGDVDEVAGGLVPSVRDVQVVVCVHGRLVLVFLDCGQLVLDGPVRVFCPVVSRRNACLHAT